MAYTYENFLTEANKAGVMDRFSKYDLDTASRNPEYGLSMLGLMQDVQKASTPEQRLIATEAANQLRKNYGVYTAGDKGTDYSYAGSYGSKIDDLMGQIGSYGSFQYSQEDAYKKLLESVANQQPFQYDPQKDPSWSAYRKQYLREGERASANAMAQASAASGGRPSSYAMNAAQQASNYYAGQLSDMLPTLEQNAYSRYLSEVNNRLNSLNAMISDRAFDYDRWMQEYNMLQNNLSNYRGQDESDYQRYLDQFNQEQVRFDNALALYKTLGYATPEIAEILGIQPSGNVQGSGKGSGGKLKLDIDSITALDYGYLTEDQLMKKIDAGKVEMVQDGNTIRFVRVEKPTGTGGKSLEGDRKRDDEVRYSYSAN